jgi:hypothetical protein
VASSTPAAGSTSATAPAPLSVAGAWQSGAAGVGVADGSFAAWRGRPLTIASTWADDNDNQVNIYQCRPGGEFANWTGDLDVAIGAIGAGESWQAAATGAYDARWSQALAALRDGCDSHARTVYIRFAHEMNGNWYPWSVDGSNYQAFDQAWIRFRNLQKQIFPAGKLVFSVNRESVGADMDWRRFFPGAQYVDVMGVDYYNQYPYAATLGQFESALNDTDGYGAPKGLEKHLAFAASVGLPLAVSEWSGNADNGDGPGYIQGMHDFFARHGGTGAGRLLYECQFNVNSDGGRWLLFGGTRMPTSADLYRQLF